MARRLGARVKFVTGQRTVGTWTVNPENIGLGQSESREVKTVGKRSGAAGQTKPSPKHVSVRPCFHPMERSHMRGKPYFRLLHLLEELAALRDKNILAPDQRGLWSAEVPKEQRYDVSRCLERFVSLNALLHGGRAGCAALWTVHLRGVEFRIHDIVRAVLGKSPPPIPFEEWSITTPETGKQKQR